MDIFSIVLISVGLAMDCFTVSISKGICAKKYFFWLTFRMAFLFGLFQASMPLLGYFAGVKFSSEMMNFDHWIAFILLLLVGLKMIIEEYKSKDTECENTPNPFKWASLLPLAFATSIDALASGIILIPYPAYLWRSILIIGSTSFIFTFIGMYIGIHFGKRFHIKVELIGGLILIGIGTKILIEHLYY